MKAPDVLFGNKILPGWEIASSEMTIEELESVYRQWESIQLDYFEPLLFINRMFGKPVNIRHQPEVRTEFRFEWNGIPCASWYYTKFNYDKRYKSKNLVIQVDCRDNNGVYIGYGVYSVRRWDTGKDELYYFTPGGWINKLAELYPEAEKRAIEVAKLNKEKQKEELLRKMNLEVHLR